MANYDNLRDLVLKHPTIQQLGVKLPTISTTSEKYVEGQYLQIIQLILQQQDSKKDALHSNLASLRNYSRGTYDVVFEVGTKHIFAHSEIVCKQSLPFRAMFLSNMTEGVTKHIKVSTEEFSIVQMMVDYFYTCEIELSCDNALPLLRLACLYGVESLRDKCCIFLQCNVNIKNCLQVVLMAQLHVIERLPQWSDLLTETCKFIKCHKEEILMECPFEGLQLCEIAQVLPLFEGCYRRLTVQGFLQWAKREWEVDDLASCLALLGNEIYATGETQIFVIDNYNHTLVVRVSLGITVVALKQVIEQKTSIPIECQYLLKSGRYMQNAQTLQACGVAQDSTIFLHTRPGKMETSITPLTTHQMHMLLYNLCVEEIAEGFISLIETPGWLQLSCPVVMDIIKRDDIKTYAEIYVLGAINAWASVCKSRKSALPSLIEHIRFPFIETADLLTIANKYPLICNCSSFKTLLEEAILFKVSASKVAEGDTSQTNNDRKRRRIHYEKPTPTDVAAFATSVANLILHK